MQVQIGSGVKGLLLSLLLSFPLPALNWMVLEKVSEESKQVLQTPQLNAEEQLPEDLRPLVV